MIFVRSLLNEIKQNPYDLPANQVTLKPVD